MSRLEKFREMRKNRRKHFFAVTFVIAFLISGLLVADYSVNCLMTGEKKIGIFSLRTTDNSRLEIEFFGDKTYIDTSYLQRDYKNLKKFLEGIFKM